MAEVREVMDAGQAAQYLGVTRSTLRRWVQCHGLPAARVGRVVRFRRVAIDRWLAMREGPAEDPDQVLWDAVGRRALLAEYGPGDEGLYDDPEALGYRQVAL